MFAGRLGSGRKGSPVLRGGNGWGTLEAAVVRALCVAVGLCLSAESTSIVADSACDFDGACAPYTLKRYGVDPPPVVTAGGPAGSFLRLAHAVVGNVNSITFEVADAVAESVVANFDFRMTPGSGRADGFGFSLVNLAYYPTSGPIGGESEEPTFLGSVGIGFDIHRGPGEVSDNHVSIHFDQVKLAEFPVDKMELDLARGGSKFIHAQIIVRPAKAAGTGDVTVVLTPLDSSGAPEGAPIVVADQFPVPDLEPYDARVHFMARSGGQSADHDLDNIVVDSPTGAGAQFQLSSASYAAVEGGGVAYFAVLRTGNLGETHTVGFHTSDLSAQSGTDYQSTTLTLSFAMGQKLKGVTVPILQDTAEEPPEEFQVELVDPSPGATLGAPTDAVVTIADEDSPELVGRWDPLLSWPAVAIHMHMLPTGQVLFWGRDEEHKHGPQPYLWDPDSPAAPPDSQSRPLNFTLMGLTDPGSGSGSGSGSYDQYDHDHNPFLCGQNQGGTQEIQFCDGFAPPQVPMQAQEWETGLYQYDLAGNVKAIGADSYRYDDLSRLKSAYVSESNLSYAYDAFGNLTSRIRAKGAITDSRTFTVDPATNRLASMARQFANLTNYSYQYDPNGNLLSDSFTGYVFDEQSRLSQVWDQNQGLCPDFRGKVLA